MQCNLFFLEPKWRRPFRFVSNLSHTIICSQNVHMHRAKQKDSIAGRQGSITDTPPWLMLLAWSHTIKFTITYWLFGTRISSNVLGSWHAQRKMHIQAAIFGPNWISFQWQQLWKLIQDFYTQRIIILNYFPTPAHKKRSPEPPKELPK